MAEKLGLTKRLLKFWGDVGKVWCYYTFSNWRYWLVALLGAMLIGALPELIPLSQVVTTMLVGFSAILFFPIGCLVMIKSTIAAEQIWRLGKIEKELLLKDALTKLYRSVLFACGIVLAMVLITLIGYVAVSTYGKNVMDLSQFVHDINDYNTANGLYMVVLELPDSSRVLFDVSGYLASFVKENLALFWTLFSVGLVMLYYICSLMLWGHGLIWLRDASACKAFRFASRAAWSGRGFVAFLKMNFLSYLAMLPICAVLWMISQLVAKMWQFSLTNLNWVLVFTASAAIFCCLLVRLCHVIFRRFLPAEQNGAAK